MAISPYQLNENFMQEVDDFEKRIDHVLAKQRIAPGGITSVDVPTGMSSTHFNILKTRYIEAGWASVTLNSNQREGTWLTFKSQG